MQERLKQPLIINRVREFGLLKTGQIFLYVCVFVISSIGNCEAAILNETNFENGQMDPWKIFIMTNGTVGGVEMPKMVPIEPVKKGEKSNSLQFKVGQIRYEQENPSQQGGGLVLQIPTETGTLHLSANVAVTYSSPKDRRNLAGGLFEWIVDDQVVANHDVGPINNGGISRHHLKGESIVKAGLHTIRLRITRPFISQPGQQAPFQYVDDLNVRFSPPR